MLHTRDVSDAYLFTPAEEYFKRLTSADAYLPVQKAEVGIGLKTNVRVRSCQNETIARRITVTNSPKSKTKT